MNLAPPRMHSAAWMALCGIAIYIAGICVTIYFYNLHHSRPYSPLNHFVSELSTSILSPQAWIMNSGLIVGSILSYPVLYTLRLHMKTRYADIGAALGFFSFICIVTLGFTPMEQLVPHVLAALGFFSGWLLTVIFFTLAFYQHGTLKNSPFFIAAGVLSTVVSLAFLACLWFGGIISFLLSGAASAQHIDISELSRMNRPTVISIALIEWAVVISVFIWILAASSFISRAPAGPDRPR